MSVTFKDYVVLTDSIPEDADQLDEAAFLSAWAKKLYDLAVKKLGDKASKEDIEKEVDRLKKLDKKDLEKIKMTKQSRDFHDRKAKQVADRAAKGTQAPRKTIATVSATPRQGAAAQRAADRDWHRQAAGLMDDIQTNDVVVEGREFIVTYKLKNSDKELKWKTKGRDSAHVKRLFGDAHYGAKLLSIRPGLGAKAIPKPKEPDEE